MHKWECIEYEPFKYWVLIRIDIQDKIQRGEIFEIRWLLLLFLILVFSPLCSTEIGWSCSPSVFCLSCMVLNVIWWCALFCSFQTSTQLVPKHLHFYTCSHFHNQVCTVQCMGVNTTITNDKQVLAVSLSSQLSNIS